jgi:cyclase
MLRPRIIPCLLIQNGGLVKTVKFQNPKYLGDPINAVKIFNEKEVDEIIVLDIDATREGRGPNFDLINKLAIECRMPFCYGGGITTLEEVKRIINLGAEKVAISCAAIDNISFLESIGNSVGKQSVVVVLDVKKSNSIFRGSSYKVYVKNGKVECSLDLIEYIRQLNRIGIGELVINSIDNDGVMEGYDLELVELVRRVTDVPLTILGGAGSVNDLKKLVGRFGIIGAAAGSFFVFKGKFRAVLLSYPSKEDIRLITKYNPIK